MEGQVADLKKRIPILKRLIADCDRMAADLDQEVRNEEHRVKVDDPARVAYSTYAKKHRAEKQQGPTNSQSPRSDSETEA